MPSTTGRHSVEAQSASAEQVAPSARPPPEDEPLLPLEPLEAELPPVLLLEPVEPDDAADPEEPLELLALVEPADVVELEAVLLPLDADELEGEPVLPAVAAEPVDVLEPELELPHPMSKNERRIAARSGCRVARTNVSPGVSRRVYPHTVSHSHDWRSHGLSSVVL